MQQGKHDWLVKAFEGIQTYLDEHNLKKTLAELEALSFTLKRELGANVLENKPADLQTRSLTLECELGANVFEFSARRLVTHR